MNGEAPSSSNGSSKSTVIRLAVGSANKAKINAVKQAFQKCLNRKKSNHAYTLDIQGFSVDSGVSAQPMGDQETCQGAKNRAAAAYLECKRKTGNYPHMAVGMEGGVEWVQNGKDDEKLLYCMAWMAIYGKRQAFTVDVFASEETTSYYGDRKPFFGLAKTGTFPIPPPLTKMIVEDGMELGVADDKFFKRKNSKEGSGSVGILTDGLIDRAGYYEHAIILALAPWIRPELYPQNES